MPPRRVAYGVASCIIAASKTISHFLPSTFPKTRNPAYAVAWGVITTSDGDVSFWL